MNNKSLHIGHHFIVGYLGKLGRGFVAVLDFVAIFLADIVTDSIFAFGMLVGCDLSLPFRLGHGGG